MYRRRMERFKQKLHAFDIDAELKEVCGSVVVEQGAETLPAAR